MLEPRLEQLEGRFYNGQTALMICASNDLEKCVQLFKNEQRLQQQNGQTALMLAVFKNNINLIQFLTKELKMKDDEDMEALDYAVKNLHVEAC